MNRYQPSANQSAVAQRMDERRAAADNYRQAREAKPRKVNDRWMNWRRAIGKRLIALGEGLVGNQPPSIPAI